MYCMNYIRVYFTYAESTEHSSVLIPKAPMLKIQEAYSNIVEAQTVIAWLNQVITTHYKQV